MNGTNQVSPLSQLNKINQYVPASVNANAVLLGSLKVVFLIGLVLYALFAFVATRQIDIMSKTLDTPISTSVRLIGYIHLLVAIGLLIFVFVTL